MITDEEWEKMSKQERRENFGKLVEQYFKTIGPKDILRIFLWGAITFSLFYTFAIAQDQLQTCTWEQNRFDQYLAEQARYDTSDLQQGQTLDYYKEYFNNKEVFLGMKGKPEWINLYCKWRWDNGQN